LEEALPGYLAGRRWFGGKARRIKGTEIVDSVPLSDGARVAAAKPRVARSSRSGDVTPVAHLILLRVDYMEGDPEVYLLPVAAAVGERAEQLRRFHPQALIATVKVRDEETTLFDATWEPAFGRALLNAVGRRRQARGAAGRLEGIPASGWRAIRGPGALTADPSIVGAEQSNTSLVFGDRLILKFFRRMEEGVNPDLEVSRFLSETVAFPHVAPVAGSIEYRRGKSEPATVAIVQKYVPNEGDAWSFTLDSAAQYLEEVVTRRPDRESPLVERPRLLDLAREEPPEIARATIGSYLDSARLLGRRTAEMHLALASSTEDPAFAPEPFTSLYQRSLYQSLRAPARKIFRLLRSRSRDIPALAPVLGLDDAILQRYRAVVDNRIRCMRIRCHGDYHLGQVLWTGKDFVIIDFEGEPAIPLGERRIKRSPLRDVAGMIRSFHYAAHTALARASKDVASPTETSLLSLWTDFWYLWVSGSFLGSYLETAGGASFLPESEEELHVLLDVLLLAKAVYELGYEANNRPDWVHIPVRGVLELVGEAP
ncbi:MAG: putative maltokinase, partial [Actinobacteria bacterium]|nr:putative maltokinase [Actinomycetota bacterium]